MPSRLRSGTSWISIGSGPLGALHIGLLAGALGAPLATSISAVEGIVVLGLVGLIWPVLRGEFSVVPQEEPPGPA